MRLSLRVDLEGQYGYFAACTEVPEMFTRCFAPMKTGDVPIISHIAGEMMAAEEILGVMKTREDAAEYLAKALATELVNAMKANDTHNGYKIED